MLLAQMDRAYVVFPRMEKKKRAGDKPSHLVLMFFTMFWSQDGSFYPYLPMDVHICGMRAPSLICGVRRGHEPISGEVDVQRG